MMFPRHHTSFSGGDMLPVHPDRYEMFLGSQGERLLMDSNEQSVLPNIELVRGFLGRTRGKLFVSIRVNRNTRLVKSGQNPIYREADVVTMVGIGRFSETSEDMENISLQSFAVAEVVNPTDDGLEFRSVVFPFGNPRTVSLDELFLIPVERSLWRKHFLYVGDAAQEFFKGVISFSQGKWNVHPMTVFGLLFRCQLTEALLENEAAQTYLVFVAGQVGEELRSCGEKISDLENQLKTLKCQADVLREELDVFRPFISK